MTMAKGLTSGYLPLGAVAVRPEIFQTFIGQTAQADFVHGHSFAGHTSSCAASLANIAIIEREQLVDRAATFGAALLQKLQSLLSHPIVGEVRGAGMAYGIEIVKDRATKETFDASLALTRKMRLRAWELGLIIRAEKDIVVLCPPLVLTEAEGDRMIAILDQIIGEAETELRQAGVLA
jgi:putrescine aminotransferase